MLLILDGVKNLFRWIFLIPARIFIDPPRSFLLESHKRAAAKFMALWAMASSPILISLLLKPLIETDNGQKLPPFDFEAFFPPTEQLVYAAAFLPALIYLAFERWSEARKEPGSSPQFALLEVRNLFQGYVFVAIIAVLVLLLAVVIYVSASTSIDAHKKTILFGLAKSAGPYVYLYALYCWYLTIIDSIQSPTDYLENRSNADQRLVERFESKVADRKDTA